MSPSRNVQAVTAGSNSKISKTKTLNLSKDTHNHHFGASTFKGLSDHWRMGSNQRNDLDDSS